MLLLLHRVVDGQAYRHHGDVFLKLVAHNPAAHPSTPTSRVLSLLHLSEEGLHALVAAHISTGLHVVIVFFLLKFYLSHLLENYFVDFVLAFRVEGVEQSLLDQV